MDVLALEDGEVVELGGLTVGGSKNHARFGRLGHQQVVVKIEGPFGRLIDEARALRFLRARGVRVPRVVRSGLIPDGRPFIVLSRETGAPPMTPAGWARFGSDIARLLDVPIEDCPFPQVPTPEFVADHHQRLQLVRPLLTDAVGQAISSAIAQIAGIDRLVVTHGDPGSGNYLDSPTGRGVLLDWETASVSPLGLDLGRASFIGLLDLWRTEIPKRLVTAFVESYIDRSGEAAALGRESVHAWTVIGGLQFVHGRATQRLRQERSPQVAVDVLERYLATVRG